MKTDAPGVELRRFERSGLIEAFATAPRRADETLQACLERAWAAVEEAGACPVKQHVFYSSKERKDARVGAARQVIPTTWTESDDAEVPHGGVFVHGLGNLSLKPVTVAGSCVGYAYRDAFGEYLMLSGLRPSSAQKSSREQAQEVFEILENALAQVDMTMTDLLRTWFYNRDILAWYADFNEVRTAFFKQHGVFEHRVPASTGIGAENPFGRALELSAFAAKDFSGKVLAEAVPSPLQGPAMAYGSSFSRAVRTDAGDHQRLTISGTASIDETGATVYTGDVDAQIEKTFDVVDALLEAQAFSWPDVVRGIAYFRYEGDIAKLREFLQTRHYPDFPMIETVNVVCRDDLLFEIEINAVKV